MVDDNQVQEKFVSELSEKGRTLVPADVAEAVAEAVLSNQSYAAVALRNYTEYLIFDMQRFRFDYASDSLEAINHE